MASGRPTSIASLLAQGERSFSFEFFPPKDAAGEEVLWRSLRELEELRPTFVSVTYGAGGSTRDRTIEITGRIARETSMTPMAHLTCVGHTVPELSDILDSLAGAGVANVLALRGDPPGDPNADWVPHPDGLSHAAELVRLIRSAGDPPCVRVAAPGARLVGQPRAVRRRRRDPPR